ncbi:hypothetical protein H5410_050077 [Solanum commersonii]|uniref:Uncharacterized protein n=1 Tax=Solanum commersonii TaxID=4109 RepID=A0A9J5WUJ6_SOLCO|nr:hypothetical protein H5410_050077 [Solanum commersonii]
MVDLNMREESWCTLKYYAWRTTVSHMTQPNVQGIRGFVDNKWIDRVRESVLPREGFTIPYTIDSSWIHRLFNPDGDPEEYLEEDLKVDPEEDLEKDPEKDHMKVSEMGSNIYDRRDRMVIDMSLEHDPEESPEYHPKPYYVVNCFDLFEIGCDSLTILLGKTSALL